jgi:5-methylcytosine-specific restriction endonuclease McrA
VNCKFCGKEIELQLWYYQHGTEHFCNRQCYDAYQKQGSQELNCDFCGKLVYIKPVFVKTLEHHFCSKSCYRKWLHFNRVYQNNPNWKGTRLYYYGPNWSDQQDLARKRDHETCQLCGCTAEARKLDVHHRIAFRKFGLKNYLLANELNNLITLCRPCHPRAEKENLIGD